MRIKKLSMRLILYNIRYGAGCGTNIHVPLPFIGYLRNTNGNLEKIGAFIKSLNPDIVGLVEVDSGSYRSEQNNQAGAIARELRHQHLFRSKYARHSLARKVPVLNKQGNALLTKMKIENQKFHYLNHGIKRLVIEVEFDQFVLFLVHLSLKFRHRRYQLMDLQTLVQRVDKPVIVAGDFNVFRGCSELDQFMAETSLINANQNGNASHPSRAPRRQLDFILYSPKICATGFQAPQVRFSDHIPLVFDFELLQENALRRAS